MNLEIITYTGTLAVYIILLIIIILITVYLTRKYAYIAGEKYGYEKRSNEQYKLIQKEISKHKESDDYKNNLENNYLKGKIDGAKEELEKFTFNYEPYVDIFETYFRKTVEVGYQIQIFYNGMPIGDPTKRVVKHNEKFKDENVKHLVDQVNETIKSIAQIGISKGIKVKTTDTPVKSSRKR
jgi:hypothetical protein